MLRFRQLAVAESARLRAALEREQSLGSILTKVLAHEPQRILHNVEPCFKVAASDVDDPLSDKIDEFCCFFSVHGRGSSRCLLTVPTTTN